MWKCIIAVCMAGRLSIVVRETRACDAKRGSLERTTLDHARLKVSEKSTPVSYQLVSASSQVICVNYAISVRGSREFQFEITTSLLQVRSVCTRERNERVSQRYRCCFPYFSMFS